MRQAPARQRARRRGDPAPAVGAPVAAVNGPGGQGAAAGDGAAGADGGAAGAEQPNSSDGENPSEFEDTIILTCPDSLLFGCCWVCITWAQTCMVCGPFGLFLQAILEPLWGCVSCLPACARWQLCNCTPLWRFLQAPCGCCTAVLQECVRCCTCQLTLRRKRTTARRAVMGDSVIGGRGRTSTVWNSNVVRHGRVFQIHSLYTKVTSYIAHCTRKLRFFKRGRCFRQ